jgi:hypothetical protein
MEERYGRKSPLDQIARDFFNYLGCHLPQQCANDEFYFLPRTEAAIQHLDILDDLSPERIQDHMGYVKGLLSEVPAAGPDDLEKEIDRLLLRQSMEGFIREFDDAKVWQSDPTLYVKIPLFATDQVASQRDRRPDHIKADLLNLLTQVPSFLTQGIKNLHSPSEISLRVAFNMAHDALDFYNRDIRTFIEEEMGEDKELFIKNKEVVEAWEQYKIDLLHLPFKESFSIGEDGLMKIFTISLSYPKSPSEILEIARNAYQKTQEKLLSLARKIDSSKNWHQIIYEQFPSISSPVELMRLYQKEIKNLRRFFYSHDIVTIPSNENVIVLQTPSYLWSLRASASYRSPLTGKSKGHGTFYITPGEDDLELISAHCPYLSAHETYPGHHILDHLRIHYSNPIRRQIESPLFYEGWACYSEQLLDELGYVQDSRKQLIQLQRQLWRDLRAILDIELQTGKITLAQGAKKIELLGFSSKRAQRQIRRFALTPGYQSCYSMGTHEILRLRKRFSSQFALKTFHDILLGGGQLPFHLVEGRLEASEVGWKRG